MLKPIFSQNINDKNINCDSKKQQIVLASNNCGKIREFQEIFATLDIEIIPQSQLNVPEIDEPYTTFVENSLHKARHCAKYTGLTALADDSGLCVHALGGSPGIHSARYAGAPTDDVKNNHKLIEELKNISERSAYFYCVLVLVRSEFDPQPIIADGIITGHIIDTPLGNNGFGYNPHFYIDAYNKTMAELEVTLKNQISHRRRAIDNLLLKLKEINHAT